MAHASVSGAAPRHRVSIRTRLAVAFLLVAWLAIGLLTALAVVSARRSVEDLAAREREEAVATLVRSLEDAYREADGWPGVELPATVSGGQVQVRDDAGEVVAPHETAPPSGPDGHSSSPSPSPRPSSPAAPSVRPSTGGSSTGSPQPSGQPAPHHSASQAGVQARPAVAVSSEAPRLVLVAQLGADGSTVTVPIVVDGQTVGTVRVTFPESGLTRAQQSSLDELTRNLVLAGVGAAALALAVAVFVSHRITRPLGRLADAVHAVEEGDRTDRPELERAPGELGALGGSVRRLVGRLDEQETSRRTMVRDVAHELRTPLTILRGSLEELVDGFTDPTPDRLASLEEEVLRLGRVIEDLDALSAADTATLSLRLQPLDLADVARDAAQSLAGQAADGDLELRCSLEPAPVSGDPGRLHQVVTNLLTNAVKFTPSGGRVEIRTRTVDGSASLDVVDTGPGIPQEELPQVFDRFIRGAAVGGLSGSGVGLAVVDELVRAHGGTVTAESLPEGGARFTVTLPTRPGEGGPAPT